MHLFIDYFMKLLFDFGIIEKKFVDLKHREDETSF